MVSYVVYTCRVYTDDVGNDVMKTKRSTGLSSSENVQEIVYDESNGHVTDDVTQPHDVTVVT